MGEFTQLGVRPTGQVSGAEPFSEDNCTGSSAAPVFSRCRQIACPIIIIIISSLLPFFLPLFLLPFLPLSHLPWPLLPLLCYNRVMIVIAHARIEPRRTAGYLPL